MPYTITRADLASITDPEWAFSADRLLPKWEDIPEEFKKPNVYSQIAEALCLGFKMPEGEVTFHEGFTDENAAKDLDRCVHAHIQSYGSKHEHKIAGVGYMISLVCKIEPKQNKTGSNHGQTDI